MLALERRNLILEKLQTEKRVVVSELSQLYEVSEETIRRDLDKLEKEGLMWIAICVFRIQATSFEKIFHTFPCFCAAYPHVPKTFPNSVSQSTSRIKRFHRHLKNHLDILIGFS